MNWKAACEPRDLFSPVSFSACLQGRNWLTCPHPLGHRSREVKDGALSQRAPSSGLTRSAALARLAWENTIHPNTATSCRNRESKEWEWAENYQPGLVILTASRENSQQETQRTRRMQVKQVNQKKPFWLHFALWIKPHKQPLALCHLLHPCQQLSEVASLASCNLQHTHWLSSASFLSSYSPFYYFISGVKWVFDHHIAQQSKLSQFIFASLRTWTVNSLWVTSI